MVVSKQQHTTMYCTVHRAADSFSHGRQCTNEACRIQYVEWFNRGQREERGVRERRRSCLQQQTTTYTHSTPRKTAKRSHRSDGDGRVAADHGQSNRQVRSCLLNFQPSHDVQVHLYDNYTTATSTKYRIGGKRANGYLAPIH